jgi:uncharacterized membrane protein YbhN (UPF0104 family)
MQIFSKPFLLFSLKAIITIGLLVGLLYYIDIEAIAESLSLADPALLLAGSLLVAANTGIHFVRWRFLLQLLSREIPAMDVLSSLLVGFTAGFFTPAQVGEFAGRIASLPDIRKSHIVGITIIDKLYLFAATVVTGVAALAIFASIHFPQFWHPAFTLLIGIFIAALITLFLMPERVRPLLLKLPSWIRDHKLYAMVGIIEETFHDRHARTLLMLSVLLYVVIAFQFYVFINAFAPVSLFDTAVSSWSVYFIKAAVLPISIGDLGVRESASVYFFSRFGVPSAAAFNASLCMFLVNVLLPSIAGTLLILKVKMK